MPPSAWLSRLALARRGAQAGLLLHPLELIEAQPRPEDSGGDQRAGDGVGQHPEASSLGVVKGRGAGGWWVGV